MTEISEYRLPEGVEDHLYEPGIYQFQPEDMMGHYGVCFYFNGDFDEIQLKCSNTRMPASCFTNVLGKNVFKVADYEIARDSENENQKVNLVVALPVWIFYDVEEHMDTKTYVLLQKCLVNEKPYWLKVSIFSAEIAYKAGTRPTKWIRSTFNIELTKKASLA